LIAVAARVSILAYLAVWLGAGTTIQLLHVRFADHDHRYCPEHQQVEDVSLQRAAGTDVVGTVRGVFHRAYSLLQTQAPAAPQGHVACVFLNALSSRNALAPGGLQPAETIREPATLASAISERICASRTLLLVAPKQSPPSSLC
jgi:hypothetical protein